MIKNTLKNAELELRLQEQQQSKDNNFIISHFKLEMLNKKYKESIHKLNEAFKLLWRDKT